MIRFFDLIVVKTTSFTIIPNNILTTDVIALCNWLTWFIERDFSHIFL